MARMSESGLPIDAVYGDTKLTGFPPAEKFGQPGEYPFARDVYPRTYVDRPWTTRQHAGLTTAKESRGEYQPGER